MIINFLSQDVADDLVLEVVVLVGTVAADEAAAKLLVDAGILDSLVNLLNGKLSLTFSLESEIITQLAFL